MGRQKASHQPLYERVCRDDQVSVSSSQFIALNDISRDNERMRSQLMELGYDVPVRKYLFEPAGQSNSTPAQTENVPKHQNTPVAGLATVADPNEAQQSSSARKRKRDEHLHSKLAQDIGHSRSLRCLSRDLMPPPLPRTKPTHLLPASESSRDNRAETLQAQSLHSSGQQIRRPRQPPSTQRQFGQHDNSNMAYGYAMSQQPVQAQLDTSPGLQRQPQAFDQHIEPQKHFGRSGYVPHTRLDVNDHDVVSLSQLSLRSYDEDDTRIHRRPIGDHNYASQSIQPFPSEYQNRATHLSEQQREYYGLSPSRSVDQRQGLIHREVRSRVQSAMFAPPPQATPHGQHTLASSPFFERDQPAFRPDTMQRSPARRNQAQLMAFDPAQGALSGTTAIPRSLIESHGMNRSSYVDPPRRPGDHPTLYQRPQYQHDMATQRQHSNMIPQTPRNSHGLLMRPDRPPPVAHRSPVESESRNYNKRITLPPSRGPPMPMATMQDETLSQVRGVRGVSSHRHIPGYQQASPHHNVARTLFSSGPRQSVRR